MSWLYWVVGCVAIGMCLILFFNYENYEKSANEAWFTWLIFAFLLGSGVSWAIQNRKWIWKNL